MVQTSIRRFSTWFIGSIAVLILLTFFSARSIASIAPEPTIPTTAIALDEQYVRVPDWSRISFRSLPPILSDGSFESSSGINQQLGYDLSRSWTAGQTADTYLKLGDFQTSLYLHVFNLYTIAQLVGLDLNQVALGDFEPIKWQTLDDLVAAIPGLDNYQVQDVPPIATLLMDDLRQFPEIDLGSTIADVLNTDSRLGDRSLGELGEQINQFELTSIPGLENVSLQNFRNWGNSFISDIPGLADVSFDQMPNPVQNVGVIGVVDVVYGTAESDRANTISGSDQIGFRAPCRDRCAHAELTGDPTVHGKQWISGQYQQVKGGFGALGAVNNGQEPTGRHPFGEGFKVSIWDVDEATGSLSTALHFRICYRGVPDLGCTPYFLGPVPFLNVREKEPIFLGILNTQGGISSAASVPTGAVDPAIANKSPASALSNLDLNRPSRTQLCGEEFESIDLNALATAFSSIEGHYDSVGSYVCDGLGNCGRGLGRYQYMSYRADVRQMIRQHEGGTAFLARLDSGATISNAEVERFLPAIQQDQLFDINQAQNIQQAIAEGFSGARLIERVGQIHFGGPGAAIDSHTTDHYERLTLKGYGEQLRREYDGAIAAGVGQSCIAVQ